MGFFGKRSENMKKKTFSSFKSLPYKNGKAENKPVVAGRFAVIKEKDINYGGRTNTKPKITKPKKPQPKIPKVPKYPRP